MTDAATICATKDESMRRTGQIHPQHLFYQIPRGSTYHTLRTSSTINTYNGRLRSYQKKGPSTRSNQRLREIYKLSKPYTPIAHHNKWSKIVGKEVDKVHKKKLNRRVQATTPATHAAPHCHHTPSSRRDMLHGLSVSSAALVLGSSGSSSRSTTKLLPASPCRSHVSL